MVPQRSDVGALLKALVDDRNGLLHIGNIFINVLIIFVDSIIESNVSYPYELKILDLF